MKSTITPTASRVALGLTMLFAVLAIGTPATATADECANIDRLARKIQRKTRLLVKKTVHYRHTNQYRALVRETSSLYGAATHIHEIAHDENNLHLLQADLAQLDQCFHRLEALFDATEVFASQGQGQIKGSTRQVRVLLDSIEDSIHRIQADVRTLQRRNQPVRRPAYFPQQQSFRPVYSGYQPNFGPRTPGCGYGVRNSGRNFSFGTGSLRIPFGF